MKLLDGKELAGFIKERHAREARALRSKKIYPKLAIVQVKDDPVINTYVSLKKKYGADIDVDVDVHAPKQKEVRPLVENLNSDDSVHGVIIQLPLNDPSETDEIVNLVAPRKDVDALGDKAEFDPATPMAIMWLLSGYGVDLKDKRVLLIGRGKLVGAPLEKLLKASDIDVTVIDRGVENLGRYTKRADVIVTATGSPAVLYSDMIKEGAVVVDAGTASEDGKTVGDLAPEVYQRDDLTITPEKGGVGPLTVCALFENVLRAAGRRREA
jgi:methylenetetrahydrofolate dehydrogenase (NADP+) / methenyltetrahydrofolate cyclohydrolase